MMRNGPAQTRTSTAARNRGYSLLELMITVSIITIVTSIALPSYQNHVMRSHRSDAMAALLKIAGQQEKFYLQNNTYTTSLTDLNTETTDNGYYTLQILNADTSVFVATATALSGEAQENDHDCQTFRIDSAGTRSADDDGGSDNTQFCWR